MTTTHAAPWYRHSAVWLLLSGPGIVVVAGFVTLFLAWHGQDGLVADDYYKRGLAINRTLARELRAAALQVSAQVRIDGGAVSVSLAGVGAAAPPALRFVHPARADLDRTIVLGALPDGRYGAKVAPLAPGRWDVILETEGWRIEGRTNVPLNGPLTLRPRDPAGE